MEPKPKIDPTDVPRALVTIRALQDSLVALTTHTHRIESLLEASMDAITTANLDHQETRELLSQARKAAEEWNRVASKTNEELIELRTLRRVMFREVATALEVTCRETDITEEKWVDMMVMLRAKVGYAAGPTATYARKPVGRMPALKQGVQGPVVQAGSVSTVMITDDRNLA